MIGALFMLMNRELSRYHRDEKSLNLHQKKMLIYTLLKTGVPYINSFHCDYKVATKATANRIRSNISKTTANFIRDSKHRETDESTRPQAECFYCFQVFGTSEETRSTSFWYSFLNELPTIIVCYYCFVLLIKQ